MFHDRLEVLSEAECRHLLTQVPVGRVGVTVGGLPVILPVNYRMDEDDVVFRTGDGTKLRAAVAEAVIAFEVDAYDATGRGWSVLAIGRAYEMTEADAAVTAQRLDLEPRSNGRPDHWVRMCPEMVSGRRIEVAPA
jgi:nitroimidazol reductase NimA-like FMN-containing flavoprotein (pyridoxamine 5'-phosphate oxidase superfamily)